MTTNTYTPGPWRIVKVLNKSRETRLAVARDIGVKREYVCSASGKRSTFCTEAGAKFALRAALANAWIEPGPALRPFYAYQAQEMTDEQIEQAQASK